MGKTGMRDADPVATASSGPVTVAASVTVLSVAALLTINHPGDVENPALMVLAFVFLVASCAILVRSSHAVTRPFAMGEHFAVVILSWAAALAAAASQWRANEYLRDDWGPYVVAIILVATTPYRPVASLIVALVGSVAFVGGLAVLQSSALTVDAPVAAFALIAAAPVTLLAGAGIAFVRAGMNRNVPAARLQIAPTDGGEHVALTEQERRVILLTHEVAPLFSWVLHRETVTERDVSRAAEISDAVRATMVYAVNQAWLGKVVRDAIDGAGAVPARVSRTATRSMAQMVVHHHVADSRNLSGRMSFEQRAVIRALLGVIFEHEHIRAETFAARIVSHDATAQLWIDVSFGPGESGAGAPSTTGGVPTATAAPRLPSVRAREVRKSLAPFFAAARGNFSSADFTSSATEQSVKVTLRFSYEL